MLWQRLIFGTILIAAIGGLVYGDAKLAHHAVTSTVDDLTAMPPLAYGMPILGLVLLLVVAVLRGHRDLAVGNACQSRFATYDRQRSLRIRQC